MVKLKLAGIRTTVSTIFPQNCFEKTPNLIASLNGFLICVSLKLERNSKILRVMSIEVQNKRKSASSFFFYFVVSAAHNGGFERFEDDCVSCYLSYHMSFLHLFSYCGRYYSFRLCSHSTKIGT